MGSFHIIFSFQRGRKRWVLPAFLSPLKPRPLFCPQWFSTFFPLSCLRLKKKIKLLSSLRKSQGNSLFLHRLVLKHILEAPMGECPHSLPCTREAPCPLPCFFWCFPSLLQQVLIHGPWGARAQSFKDGALVPSGVAVVVPCPHPSWWHPRGAPRAFLE